MPTLLLQGYAIIPIKLNFSWTNILLVLWENFKKANGNSLNLFECSMDGERTVAVSWLVGIIVYIKCFTLYVYRFQSWKDKESTKTRQEEILQNILPFWNCAHAHGAF